MSVILVQESPSDGGPGEWQLFYNYKSNKGLEIQGKLEDHCNLKQIIYNYSEK